MSFATLASALIALGSHLPAFLAFAEAMYQAWLVLQSAIGAPPKLQARLLTSEDHEHIRTVAATAGGNFDGHRVANLMKFLADHPQLLNWALAFFKVPPIPFPVNPPAPRTTA